MVDFSTVNSRFPEYVDPQPPRACWPHHAQQIAGLSGIAFLNVDDFLFAGHPLQLARLRIADHQLQILGRFSASLEFEAW